MEIKTGEFYVNKTWKYLVPCMRDHGTVFNTKTLSIFKLAFGIGDVLMNNESINKEKAIFILIDKKVQFTAFMNFMAWIVNQEYYLFDYPFDDVIKGRKHMLVLKIPDQYGKAYEHFLKGEYSKMYSLEEIDRLFGIINKRSDSNITDRLFISKRLDSNIVKLRSQSKDVILKSVSMRKPFIQKLKKSFGDDLDIKESDLTGKELDFPIEKQKEIFNYDYRH